MESKTTIALGLFLALLFLTLIWASLFRKCGPNQAMIISGWGAGSDGQKFKIVVGGGAMVLPVLQQYHFLSLEVITFEVRDTAPIITPNSIPIFIEGVAQVKITCDNVSIAAAAERFLGKKEKVVIDIAHQILLGHIRALLSTMDVEQLIQNFDDFSRRVQNLSNADLANIGLMIDFFIIKEIKDNVGYLEALGQKRMADAKRAANNILQGEKISEA